jgi:hypothetical protein
MCASDNHAPTHVEYNKNLNVMVFIEMHSIGSDTADAIIKRTAIAIGGGSAS